MKIRATTLSLSVLVALFLVTGLHGASSEGTSSEASNVQKTQQTAVGNPLIRDLFTADPAALVHGDTVYLYVGHDEAKGKEMFAMKEWLCYSSKDMKTWVSHGSILKPTDFVWGEKDAWASQVVEKDGKFYFFTTVQHKAPDVGKAIGVAVSDSPTGPFKDAVGPR
jgi:beta-xylosidase